MWDRRLCDDAIYDSFSMHLSFTATMFPTKSVSLGVKVSCYAIVIQQQVNDIMI